MEQATPVKPTRWSNKAIYATIARQSGHSQLVVKDVLLWFFRSLKLAIIAHQPVELYGVGVFTYVFRRGRVNPFSGKFIPNRMVPKFKISESLNAIRRKRQDQLPVVEQKQERGIPKHRR